MRIVAISDCRTTTGEQIERLFEREKPDLLLYGGDDVARFGPVPDEVYVEAGVMHLRTVAGEAPPAEDMFQSKYWGVPDAFWERASFGFSASLSARIRARALSRAGPSRERRHGPHVIRGEQWTFEVIRWFHSRPAINWSPLASRIPHGIAGVLGNDCVPADAWVLQQPGCHDLHTKPMLLPGLAIIGLAGAPARDGEGRGLLLYDEEAAAAHLARQLAACGNRDVILVSHAPPLEILDLAVRHGIENIGSRAVRDLVDAGRVAIVVCGHVHREGGKTQRITPDCAVVNVACHDDAHAALRYAVIEVETGYFDITHHELPNEGLHQISGIGPKLAEQLRSAGIREISQLAALGREEVTVLLGPRRGPQMQAHARSLLRGLPVSVGGRPSPPEPVIYLDVETSHDVQDDPWLIGLLFPDGRFEQMQALDRDDHPAHLQALDARLKAYPGHTFMQWGSFDRIALEKAYARCGLPSPGWLEKHRWLDACVWLRQHVALPIHSLALRVVCRYFDYEVRHPHLSGMTVGVWYSRYRDEGADFDVPAVREYNEDDVRALAHVVAAACRLGAAETSG